MLDLKFPADMPFKQTMILATLFGASLGLCLGIGATAAVFVAGYFHLVK